MEKLQPDVELLWYAALADSSSHVRHRLVRLLADADTRLSRDVLADAAFDADERVATSAVLALGQSINNSEYDVQNIERLANVCAVLQRSPHEKLRHLGAQRATAIEAWGVSRSPASSSHARLTARRAAQHDPAHAREAALRRMEQWPDRPIEAVAAARTAESAGVDVLAEFFELTALLLDFPGDERRHEHAHALADAAKLLAHAHGRRRDELLGACVVDSDPRVRANAVESLGTLLRRGSVSIGGYLGTLLDDTNSRVRANAAVALSRSSLDADIDSGVHAIDSMLRDGRPAHRIAGLWALGAAAAALATSRSHMPALVSLGAEAARLAKADPDQSLRWRAGRTAAMVLVLLKTPSHMPHAERPPIDAASPSYSDLRIAEVAR